MAHATTYSVLMRDQHDARSSAAHRSARALSVVCALVALFALASCSGRNESARLITISAAQADEDSGRVYVLGDGFAVGLGCELTLRGSVFPPRRNPEPLSAAVPCHALTAERVVASLEEPSLAPYGTALFEGRVELSFRSESGAGVSGSLEHVRLRLGAHERSRVAEELAVRRAAVEFQRDIGIPAVEVGARGVVITALDEAGRAAVAGVALGDVVQRINGAPVEAAFDFLPASDARVAQLEVQRRGTSGTLLLSIPLLPRTGSEDLAILLVLALGCIAGVLLPRVRVLRVHAAQRRELALAFALFVALVAAAVLVTERFDARLPWLVMLATTGVALWLAYARGRISTFGLLREVAALSSATSCVAALALVTGSLGGELTAASFEGALPWQWALFAAPAGWLAAVGLVATCPPPGAQSVSHPFVRQLRLAATACVLAGLGLGGGLLPLSLDLGATALSVVGASTFALKGTAALAVLAMAPRPKGTSLVAHLASFSAPLVALLAPLVWPGSIGPSQPALGFGALLAGLVLGVVLHAVGHALLGRQEPVRDPALAPFL